ncbi:MAG: peptidoglycan DD-metalloendopeptidase family protein [Leptospiraceae bacterium]|nr:peptidoglycan DD-metalloendopeptidase family protein [Leptospiraceae bacterium]
MKKGDCENAIPHLQRAVEAQEPVTHIYINLHACYYKAGRHHESVAVALSGTQRFPGDESMRKYLALARHGLGWQYMREQKIGLAREQFAQALELQPDHADIMAAFGITLLRSSDSSDVHQSMDLLYQARKKSPDTDYIQNNLMAAYYKSLQLHVKHKEYDEADTLIDLIYNDRSEHPEIYLRGAKSELAVSDMLDELTAGPFMIAARALEDKHSLTELATCMQSVMEKWPNLYRLRHWYGVAVTKAGDARRGHALRKQAYGDYRRIVQPKEHPLLLEVPLRGWIYPCTKPDSDLFSHSGLFQNATDYTHATETSLQNLSYEKPVYAPIDGVLVEVDNTHPTDARVIIQIQSGIKVELIHLKAGSIKLRKGEHVKTGQFLGLLGWKENAHLHMHVWGLHGVTIPYRYKRFQTKNGQAKNNQSPKRLELFYYNK